MPKRNPDDFFGSSCAVCGGLAVATPVLQPVNYVLDEHDYPHGLCDDAALLDKSDELYAKIYYCQDCDAPCEVLPVDFPGQKEKRLND